MLTGKRIGFIGAGSIAQAMLGGLLGAQLVEPGRVTVTNRSDDRRLCTVAERWGVKTTRDRCKAMEGADVLIIACKPADAAEVLAEIAPSVKPSQLVLSVMAGVTTATVEGFLPEGTPVVRAMPNTSSRIRRSATALCGGRWADENSLSLAEAVFASIGRVVVVPEALMDAVTAVSGSGPAYVYLFAESLIGAGVEQGLSPETARDLVVQTLLGAAFMLCESGEDPADLRRAVTSPRGTTAAALEVLEERGFTEALADAVAKAAARARELAALATASAGVGEGASHPARDAGREADHDGDYDVDNEKEEDAAESA